MIQQKDISSDRQSSYRNIFKATSLFGGVQVYQILISVIKSKVIALLLGPLGLGILGLFTSATELVKQITSFGLAQSAIRDVSEASGCGDTNRINVVITVLRKIIWITGLLGAFVLMIFSSLLSKMTFGNNDYTVSFIILSIIILFDQLCAGQKVILQGMRKLKDLAKATIMGSTIGLILSIPLYYIFGLNGIVPTLILNSITSFLLSWYFSRKVTLEKVSVTPGIVMRESANMLKMGIAMSISGILVSACSYVLRGFIRQWGGTESVGLFQAGFFIINSYVGLIFTAMSTDYYPRLAAVNKDNEKCRDIINKQGEIATLIMAPLLTICLVFMPFCVELLYSKQFVSANDYIMWATLGMMFKLASWLVSFQFIAKAESKLFIINEIISNVYCLILNMVGYKLLGLAGLGISFTLSYLIYFFQVFLIAKNKYSFSFCRQFLRLYSIQFLLVVFCLILSFLLSGWSRYVFGGFVILLSCFVSLYGLERRINVISIVKKTFKDN